MRLGFVETVVVVIMVVMCVVGLAQLDVFHLETCIPACIQYAV